MYKVRTVLVDDEQNGRENLRGALQQYCPEIEIIAEADSAMAAIDIISKEKPDLVFLDIEMPGGNGFKVLEFFSDPKFSVIFVTAYDHYAIQAIRFTALDYILKSIDIFLLKDAVKRYIHNKSKEDNRLKIFLSNNTLSNESKRIALPTADKINYIEISRIIKCQAESSYTRFFLDSGEVLLVSKSLVEYEEIISDSGFIRTHKSFVVNTKHIQSFVKKDGGYLIMSDHSTVPVSRRKKEFVLSQIY
nr:LytTR family DNA-binding domain-containing protein [uncultured Carboxylicivirga sp.]